MALITPLESQAVANLQKIVSLFNCYDANYGFRNSVMVKAGPNYGKCSSRFYALEQEWIFLSIIDHENGFIWNDFYKIGGVVDTHEKMYTSKKDADTTGVFRPGNGLLYLKNKNETGIADMALNYGLGGDSPVVGDWDGDGTVTIGIYRTGYFYLRNENTIGFAEVVFPFGNVGDQPVAGDWNGDGIDTIGIYRPSTGQFLLRNSNSEGNPAMSFYLGNVGDVGIAGDWDGNGIDTTGVFRPSNGLIFLKNKNSTGIADFALNYGLPGDQPVTGDWNNDGVDTIGVYRNGTFFLRNENTNGFAEIVFGLGNPGDLPIAGDWEGFPYSPNLPKMIEIAKQDLAQRLSLPINLIHLIQARQVEWSNTSLGCPEPGKVYLDVLMPGYLILLNANFKAYEYHSGGNQNLFYCENPVPPVYGISER